MLEIIRYEPEHAELWNRFIQENGYHFFFHRNYLQYHEDRFTDYSLIILDNSRVRGVFPLTHDGSMLVSHGGLTFGGVLLEKNCRTSAVYEALSAALKYLLKQDFLAIQIKQSPSIYNYSTVEIQKNAIFQHGGIWKRCDITYAVDLEQELGYSSRKRRNIRKAGRNDLVIRETSEFREFWEEVLVPNLRATHSTSPVHTAAEIQLLRSRFPSNIAQFNVYKKDEIVAGATIYISGRVAHAQYIAASEVGKELSALDLLFNHLISLYQNKSFEYLNFGTVNEDQGRRTNLGLAQWKEEFGAQVFAQDFFEITF